MLKNEIRDILRQNDQIVMQMKSMEEQFQIDKKKRELIEKQTAKAIADKKELTRDVSTYECNFGCKQQEIVKLSLTSILRRILAAQKTIKANPGLQRESGWVS